MQPPRTRQRGKQRGVTNRGKPHETDSSVTHFCSSNPGCLPPHDVGNSSNSVRSWKSLAFNEPKCVEAALFFCVRDISNSIAVILSNKVPPPPVLLALSHPPPPPPSLVEVFEKESHYSKTSLQNEASRWVNSHTIPWSSSDNNALGQWGLGASICVHNCLIPWNRSELTDIFSIIPQLQHACTVHEKNVDVARFAVTTKSTVSTQPNWICACSGNDNDNLVQSTHCRQSDDLPWG